MVKIGFAVLMPARDNGKLPAAFRLDRGNVGQLKSLSNDTANRLLIELAIWESFKYYGNYEQEVSKDFKEVLDPILTIFDDLGFSPIPIHYLDNIRRAA